MDRRDLVLALAATAVLATTLSAAPTATAAEDAGLPYGTIVRVAPSTLMVAGRPLNPGKGEGDIGNVILYRRGATLYMIDAGATPSFRPFLRRAIDRLRPFRKVVLINSHGHPDHFGNNSIATDLGARSVRYYMSQRDFALADNYEAELRKAFELVRGYVPGFDDPAAGAHQLLSLFQPLEMERNIRRPIESLPSRTEQVGRLRIRGWQLGKGDVIVLPINGHTAGSLSVYFPRTGLLHVADELNGWYPAFPESSATTVRRAFGRLLRASAGDDVRELTDGHTYGIVVRGAARIRAHLQAYVDGYDAYDRLVRRVLTDTPGGATVGEIAAAMEADPALQRAPGGATFAPFFATLVVLKKLEQLGAIGTGDPPGRRFTLPPY